MTIGAGITAVIANPLDKESLTGVLAGDLLVGNDEHCMNWLTYQRKEEAGS
jgi:hypothetical protein